MQCPISLSDWCEREVRKILKKGTTLSRHLVSSLLVLLANTKGLNMLSVYPAAPEM